MIAGVRAITRFRAIDFDRECGSNDRIGGAAWMLAWASCGVAVAAPRKTSRAAVDTRKNRD
jgi:hypothetical protein